MAPVSTELFEVAALQPGEAVVDVGCGGGTYTRAWHELGAAMVLDRKPDVTEVLSAPGQPAGEARTAPQDDNARQQAAFGADDMGGADSHEAGADVDQGPPTW